MKEEVYRGKIIRSSPYQLLQGGFSSNGVIEIQINIDTVREVIPFVLQGKHFETEDEVNNFYLLGAKNLIDRGEI